VWPQAAILGDDFETDSQAPQRAPACALSVPTPYVEHSGNICNRPASDRPEHRKDDAMMMTSEPAWIVPAK
ncbi:hypothetical protein, partial [Mesorhizobium sp.]|uniref:hypothetical protein n=1 Tax=Mesorhizobium sp. TaxID=1871066 RepID=UPI0025EB287A